MPVLLPSAPLRGCFLQTGAYLALIGLALLWGLSLCQATAASLCLQFELLLCCPLVPLQDSVFPLLIFLHPPPPIAFPVLSFASACTAPKSPNVSSVWVCFHCPYFYIYIYIYFVVLCLVQVIFVLWRCFRPCAPSIFSSPQGASLMKPFIRMYDCIPYLCGTRPAFFCRCC